MALPLKIVSYLGVLEYWSVEVLEKAKAAISTLSIYHYSITPLLHYSSKVPDEEETLKAKSPGPAIIYFFL